MINPVQRIRDAKRNQKPLQKVAFADWTQISDRALEAEQFFKGGYINSMIIDSLKDAEDAIITNRVKEVKEITIISAAYKKIFTTPKKIQDDELVGQIKFIRQFLQELKTQIDYRDELLKKEANGEIAIERNQDVQQ